MIEVELPGREERGELVEPGMYFISPAGTPFITVDSAEGLRLLNLGNFYCYQHDNIHLSIAELEKRHCCTFIGGIHFKLKEKNND